MAILKELQRELTRLADPQKAEQLQRFFKTGPGEYAEGDLFRGIRVPVLRKLVNRFEGIGLADAGYLLESPYHEDRLTALLLMVRIAATGDEETKSRVYRRYMEKTAFINNWDLVDSSAEHIIGSYLDGKSKAPLIRLARSSNIWERRMAVMATFFDIKHNRFEPTFIIAEMLLDDAHHLIHKAVGWMLREIGKRDQRAEEGFLRKHYRRMPRTMLRYAIEKLPERQRKAYLTGKVRQAGR